MCAISFWAFLTKAPFNNLQIHINKLLRKIRNDPIYLSNISYDLRFSTCKEIIIKNVNNITILGLPNYDNLLLCNTKRPTGHSYIFSSCYYFSTRVKSISGFTCLPNQIVLGVTNNSKILSNYHDFHCKSMKFNVFGQTHMCINLEFLC